MTNKANESFSAFLDGEASELDIQRMLKALDDQPELFSQWHDLSKAQAALHDDEIVDVALNVATLNDATVDESYTKKGMAFRLKQTGIAAAVAFSVVGVATFMNFDDATPEMPVATVVSPSEYPASVAQQQFEAQQRLDAYLREHAEQASFTTGHAVVPAELEWVDIQ